MQMLDDMKLLALTANGAGPGATAIFTNYGAKVIKV